MGGKQALLKGWGRPLPVCGLSGFSAKCPGVQGGLRALGGGGSSVFLPCAAPASPFCLWAPGGVLCQALQTLPLFTPTSELAVGEAQSLEHPRSPGSCKSRLQMPACTCAHTLTLNSSGVRDFGFPTCTVKTGGFLTKTQNKMTNYQKGSILVNREVS